MTIEDTQFGYLPELKTWEVPGFVLYPNLHGLHHIVKDIEKAMQRGAPLILNPLIFNCEPNEDVVGKTSRLSRRVSQRTLGMRVLDLWKINARALFKRFFKA